VVNTLTDRLAVGSTLGNGLFAVTPPDTDAVDEVTLLGFVAETTGLVWAGRTGSTMDNVQLAVLPAPNAEEKSEDIRLLLLVELSNILVRAHLLSICWD